MNPSRSTPGHGAGKDDPTLWDMNRWMSLDRAFEGLANRMRDSINARPIHAEAGSPASDDFQEDLLEQRSLLMHAVPAVLALLQSIRGNARSAQVIYEALGPARADPATLELMRGIWEKSLLVRWVLDPEVPSPERLGRMKGWLAESLKAAGRGPWAISPRDSTRTPERAPTGCSMQFCMEIHGVRAWHRHGRRRKVAFSFVGKGSPSTPTRSSCRRSSVVLTRRPRLLPHTSRPPQPAATRRHDPVALRGGPRWPESRPHDPIPAFGRQAHARAQEIEQGTDICVP